MMYKSPKQARAALARWTTDRAYLIAGETITPAEVWLLDALYMFRDVKRSDRHHRIKRKLIGHARSLGLYPIPDWYLVRKRIIGELKQGEIFWYD